MKRILALFLIIALAGIAGAGWYDGGTTVTIADEAVTDDKLAADVKVGSLGDLTTTAQDNVTSALNEVDANADAAQSTADAANTTANAAYTKPAGGINETDLATSVTTNLTAASTAMQGSTAVTDIRVGTVQLNGWAYTPVAFQGDGNATITGATDDVDLSGVGDGGTILLTIDSESEDTATLNCAAGYHTGGGSASTNMASETDTKFQISVNGGAAVEVTCDWTDCTTGNAVAAAMQTAVRSATGGQETVAFSTDHYVITSTMLGTTSAVNITRAASLDACDELDIGPAGGTDTAGTGDCGDITAVTVDELVTLLEGDIEGATFANATGTLTATSDTAGRGSRILAGSGTLNTAVGLPNAEVDFGEVGLDYASDMSDANYIVQATMTGDAVASGDDLSTNTKTTSGFSVYAETTSNTDYADLAVFGVFQSLSGFLMTCNGTTLSFSVLFEFNTFIPPIL